MDEAACLTIGELSALAGVAVPTLRHWDRPGLLPASGRSAGGYRLYTAGDAARCRRIMRYRRLGMPLERIMFVLDSASSDELLRQRAALVEQRERIDHELHDCDALLAAKQGTLPLPEHDQRELFGESWPAHLRYEAAGRWSCTIPWHEYAERAALRTRDDWAPLIEDMRRLDDDWCDAHRHGASPGDETANGLAGRHLRLMNQWFHCTLPMQVQLADLYAADPAFRSHYDRRAPGLADFVSAAIRANARWYERADDLHDGGVRDGVVE